MQSLKLFQKLDSYQEALMSYRWRQKQLTTDNIAIKRPGIGIQPEFRRMIVGTREKRYIKADEIIKCKDLEFSSENDR